MQATEGNLLHFMLRTDCHPAYLSGGDGFGAVDHNPLYGARLGGP
jgi:hypothetical protein